MKKPSLPKPITILILTLLTTVMWVGLSIYRAFSTKPPTLVSEDVSRPLDATLNTNVIQKIESAIFFSDSEIPQVEFGYSAGPSPSPTEATTTPAPTSEASPSASPQIPL